MIKRILTALIVAALLTSPAIAAVQTKTVLKTYFVSGAKPTSSQFGDLIDSFQNFGTPTNIYYTDTGTASAYVIATSPVTAAYTDGLSFIIKFANASTGGSTLDAGAGAVPLVFMDGMGISSGTIPANGIGIVAYSSTSGAFQLLNILPSSSGGGITALTGDVTASGTGSVATTIAANAITNAKLATMAANTVKVNATGSSATPTDLTIGASQLVGRGSAGNIVAVTLGSGLSMSAGGQLNTSPAGTGIVTVSQQVFTSSGTYTPCAGIAYAIGEAVAGGGGSGGTQSGKSSGGGGAGSYSRSRLTAAQIGASQAVTIGSAGTAGTASVSGGNGGDSSIGSLVVAKGGHGSVFGSLSVNAGGAGGVAGTGGITVPGNPGHYGFLSADAVGGVGGVAPAYSSAPKDNVIDASSSSGIAGANYGSGATGAASVGGADVGAAGAKGIVVITEYCTQ